MQDVLKADLISTKSSKSAGRTQRHHRRHQISTSDPSARSRVQVRVRYVRTRRSYGLFFVLFKGEVRSKIKLSHFVEFGALIRMVLVRGASEQPFLRYSNFKDYQIWENLFMSR